MYTKKELLIRKCSTQYGEEIKAFSCQKVCFRANS